MTTFSIASILGDQNAKHEETEDEEEDHNSIEDQHQILLNNSVQHLYNLFCKNTAVAARLNEQHHNNKANLMRLFPLGTTPSSSNDYYPLHKLNTTSYQGNHHYPMKSILIIKTSIRLFYFCQK
jgi:hypothetical protein